MQREKHGSRHTKLYVVWCNMRNRCDCISNKEYKNYGGRGIKVCADWYSFTAFRTWAFSSGYTEGLTIDRIDNDKGYYPENCRWITLKEQANNKTNNHYITYKGETKTLKQWSEILAIPYNCLRSRLNNCKYTVEKAFSNVSYKNVRMIRYKGKEKRLSEWCKELGLNYGKVKRRLNLHWSVERAFEEK